MIVRGELQAATDMASKAEDYTIVLDSMLTRDKSSNFKNNGPFEDVQLENNAYEEEL